jgi:O-succinylbenzoic acid--CoA ligase
VQLDTAASLRPVHGPVDAVYDLLTDWLESSDEPLTVRTSGSTGRPKDVLLSQAAVRASAEVTLSRLGGPGQWVVALPVIYVAGLQVVTRSVIARSRPVSLADVEGIADATRMMTGDRRYLACVPTQLFRWLSEPISRGALTTYDAVIVGGASTDTELLRRAHDAGVAVVTTYGMTETCGGCVYDGLPLDGVAVAIDTEGEIRIAGPMLFDGYQAEPQRTAQVLQGGWFHTGDLGAFDDDGRLVVSGRFDDVVVSGGVNVTVSAVEQRLLEMPGIESACVVGHPDPEWGTRVVAFVVPRRGERPTVKAARDFVAETLPRTWAPHQFVLLDAIPVLESGKPDREALRTASTGG